MLTFLHYFMIIQKNIMPISRDTVFIMIQYICHWCGFRKIWPEADIKHVCVCIWSSGKSYANSEPSLYVRTAFITQYANPDLLISLALLGKWLLIKRGLEKLQYLLLIDQLRRIHYSKARCKLVIHCLLEQTSVLTCFNMLWIKFWKLVFIWPQVNRHQQWTRELLRNQNWPEGTLLVQCLLNRLC